MAVWKEIVKFAADKGKEAAIDKYGYKAVKGAQDSMKRSASRKKDAIAKKKESEQPEVKTPTKRTKARKTPTSKQSRQEIRDDLMEMMRRRPDEAMTTVVGPGVSSASKKRIMKPSKARKKVEQETGETRAELESRISREASQMGVQPGGGPAGPAKPKYRLSREQASEAMRGKYDVESKSDVEDDLVDMLQKVGLKKGGKVPGKARGCGAAMRGYGRVMGGRK
jgi:hypothetical protein